MTRETANAAKQLSSIAALMLVGYLCQGKFRLGSDLLNRTLFCGLCALPFFAIRPLLQLRRASKIIGMLLLLPLLLFSSISLFVRLVFGNTEHVETLQTFQVDANTIELQRYENGGAVGTHGINLEQRRTIVPGFYLVKSVAFFDNAREGVISMEQPYVFRVHATGNYDSNDHKVDKICRLKPWVYF